MFSTKSKWENKVVKVILGDWVDKGFVCNIHVISHLLTWWITEIRMADFCPIKGTINIHTTAPRNGAVWNWSHAIGCLMGVEEGGEWEEERSVRQKQPQRHTDWQEDNVMVGGVTNMMLVGLGRTLQREAGPPCFEQGILLFIYFKFLCTSYVSVIILYSVSALL